MATQEKPEDPRKDNKVAHSEEQEKKPSKDIQDKGIEAKDVKNSGDVNEKVVVEKKNNAVEKEDVSKSTIEKLEKAKKDPVVPHSDQQERGIEIEGVKNAGESKSVIEKAVVEEKKKAEDEGKEVVVEDKRKEGEAEEEKNDEAEKGEVSSESSKVEKMLSFREESNFLSDLKEHERKALMELRSKIEDAILGNKLFKVKKVQVLGNEKGKILEKEGGVKEKIIENAVTEAEKGEESSKKVEEAEEKEKKSEKGGEEMEKMNAGKGEEKAANEIEKEKETSKNAEEIEVPKPSAEKALVVKEEKEDEEKEKKAEEGPKEISNVGIDQERKVNDEINNDIAIWGVPLLPSKGDSATDVILLKFLRAREFEVNDAFEMLRNTLQWRKDSNVDSILDEDFGNDLGSIGQMIGVGREGHPVCYSNFKVLGDEGLYNKILGTEESREMFIRRRVQLMEKAIQKLNFNPGGVSSILLVNDLKDSPGPSRKELRLATKQVVSLLQDNYPEFVARNIFINVPFWYYAFSASALLLPFLTPRTNSKFVFARPSRVTDVLLKYIAAEELPVHYGGLKRENDSQFSNEDAILETVVNPSSSETILIPAPEAGTTLTWEVTVLGWEVNYKEEFFPTNEGSYGIIVQKGRRISAQEASVRNSFTNNEPGNVVITIDNGALMKKKRICYRYKMNKSSSS